MSNLKLFSNIEGIECFENRDLTKYSTMRLKAFGNLIHIKTKNAASKVIQILNKNNINYFVLGWGSNILLKEKYNGIYIKLDFEHEKNLLDEKKEIYDLPASFPLHLLTAHALRYGNSGWEVFTGVPATLGGAIFMNAGTNLGEICELLLDIEYLNRDGEVKKHTVEKNSFSYRKNNFLKDGELILSARLTHKGFDTKVIKVIRDYLELRKKTQPLNKFTCGCIFKNHTKTDGQKCRAGQYIEISGLKGLVYKGLRVSPVHANFIENISGATYEEVLEFINIIKTELKLTHGIDFELEVK